MAKEQPKNIKWWHTSFILCTYGFFKEFRPSEPYISPYLTIFKNFTITEINEEMFPVGTYCYLSLLILIFLLTDFLRYKPILLTGSISGVLTWCLLIWGTTMKEMQAVEFFYGLFLASDVAYYAYIYAKVGKKYYQRVTSQNRAAILLGKALAGLSSEILVSLNVNYLQLNYFSVFGVGITIPVLIFLPSASQSIYFHPKETDVKFKESETVFSLSNEMSPRAIHSESRNKRFSASQCKAAFRRICEDFKQIFTKLYVLQWSIWWALATCGYLQAISYCQLLWQDIIGGDDSRLYHGYVEFVYAISGAVVAFGVGYLRTEWNNWSEIFLGLLTISQGGFLFYSAYINHLYLAYLMFILYRDFYEAAITIATYEVAKFINEDSHALVFGINTFAALIVQSILTVVVLGTLQINIRDQYKIYGGYHFAVGFAFLAYGISTRIFLFLNTVEK